MASSSMIRFFLCCAVVIALFQSSVESKRFSRHQKTKDDSKLSLPNDNDRLDSEATAKPSLKADVCQGWWCGHGKECQSGKNGMPECVCQKRCPNIGPTKKKVCGSDGKLYPSHCELHRTACLTNTLLYIDHTGICLEDDKDNSDEDDDFGYDDVDKATADNANQKDGLGFFKEKSNDNYYDMFKETKQPSKQGNNKDYSKDKGDDDDDDDDWKLDGNVNDAPIALPLLNRGGKIDAKEVESWPKFDSSKPELGYKVRAPVKSAETRKSGSLSASGHYIDTKSGLGPLPGLPKLGDLNALNVMESLESELDDDDDDDDVDYDHKEADEDDEGDKATDTDVKGDDFDMDTTSAKYNGRNDIKNDAAARMDDNDLTFYPKDVDAERKPRKKSNSKQQQQQKQQRESKKTTSSSNRKMHVDNVLGRDSSSSSVCSPQEYEILKDNLLLYCHEKMIGGVQNFKKVMESGNNENNNKQRKQSSAFPHKQRGFYNEALGDGPEAGKEYLLSLMFSHFDQNNNGALEYEELEKMGKEQNLGKLAPGCTLVDLLRFDDEDRSSQLSINEFYTAFNKLYSVSVISLDKAVEVTQVTVNVGDNVELKCDINGSPPTPIVWKRYGVDLSTLNQEDQVRVFSDGTLFLSKIQLLHAGNYTCQAQRNDKVVQTHMLAVQTLPDVKVTPHMVWEKPGRQVTLECRVNAQPMPVVRWLKNDDPLLPDSDKYVITGDSIRLTLKDIYFASTGAYICEAENSAGKRLDIASLVVIDDETPSTGQANESQFFVFHELGISVYNPDNCRIQHQISATDIIPGTQEYVCGEHGQVCEWGNAIQVASTYVYVSQPKLDRILVISITQMVVVDVVSTDRFPVELNYVPQLDQVWVRCWRKDENGSQKTLQVIRDAKEKKKHHTVHPEPIDSHFDLVENIFLPPDLKSSSQFRFAYVSHKNTRGLYKMDLVGIRYTKSIDLTPYNCFPQHVEFSALYGMIIVECFEPVTKRPTGQLVLDALTDAVVYFKGDRFGRPYLSPDSRKLITITHSSDGTTLMLQFVKENGLEFVFDVKTSLNISDISFFPSQRLHTYDLYASCADKDEVLFLNLESGKVEMVSGVGGALQSSSIWRSAQRPISSQGLFSNYLVTPSSDAVFILNGRSHTVNCQIGGIPKPSLIVWL